MLDIKSEATKFINKTLKLTKEKSIKPEQLEKYTNRYITIGLLDRESDIIYKIKGQDIFIIIEHQTQIDYKMPIRMIEYGVEVIKSAIDYTKIKNADYEMPSVIPIVLYTGKTKWKARKSISEKQKRLNGKDELKCTKYNLVDVNGFTEEELIKEKTYIAKAMLIEKHKNTEELTRYLKVTVEEVIKHKEKYNEQAEEIFVNLIKRILKKKIGSKRADELVKKLKGVDEYMLTSLATIEEENRTIFANGRTKGIKEGKIEGIKQNKLEIIKNMLKENLPIELISRITGESKEEIEKLEK